MLRGRTSCATDCESGEMLMLSLDPEALAGSCTTAACSKAVPRGPEAGCRLSELEPPSTISACWEELSSRRLTTDKSTYKYLTLCVRFEPPSSRDVAREGLRTQPRKVMSTRRVSEERCQRRELWGRGVGFWSRRKGSTRRSEGSDIETLSALETRVACANELSD